MIPTHVQFEISYLNRVMQFCIMPSKVELSDNFFSLETRPHLCPPCEVLVHLLHWGPIWGLLHIQNWALLSPFEFSDYRGASGTGGFTSGTTEAFSSEFLFHFQQHKVYILHFLWTSSFICIRLPLGCWSWHQRFLRSICHFTFFPSSLLNKKYVRLINGKKI